MAVRALAAKAMLLGQVVKVLSVHSGFTSGGADVAVVPFEQPRHVAAFEIRLERGARLTIAKCWVKVRGPRRRQRTISASQSRRHIERFGAWEISVHSSEGVGCSGISVGHLHSPGEGENLSSPLSSSWCPTPSVVQPPPMKYPRPSAQMPVTT